MQKISQTFCKWDGVIQGMTCLEYLFWGNSQESFLRKGPFSTLESKVEHVAPSDDQLCSTKNVRNQKITCLDPKSSEKFQSDPMLEHFFALAMKGPFNLRKSALTLEPVGIFWNFLGLNKLFFDS